MMRAALLLLVLVLPGLAGAATLTPFKASYAARYGIASGTAQMQLLEIPGGKWAYEALVQPRGAARMIMGDRRSRSEFRLEEDKVVPQSFVSDEHAQNYTFDWTAGRVTGSAERKPVSLPLQAGMLDEYSAQVALMHELNAGRTPTRFVLVDDGRVKDYLYAAEGSEVIEWEAGSQRTDIYSSRRPGSKKVTYFWCAPELGNIPLKVERRNGRDVEWSMRLTELQR